MHSGSSRKSGEKMKLLSRLALLGAAALSQSAWADTGPYYVSYPGYCNVKKIYVASNTDIYGTEIGCSAIFGQSLMGGIATNGYVAVAKASTISNVVCFESYAPNGTLQGGCSNGGPISYAPTSVYNVRQSVNSTPPQPHYVVSTEMPDLEKTKNLPPRPE